VTYWTVSSHSSQFWTVKTLKTRKILKKENYKAVNLQESAEILMETHFPGSVFPGTTNWTEVPTTPSQYEWQCASAVID